MAVSKVKRVGPKKVSKAVPSLFDEDEEDDMNDTTNPTANQELLAKKIRAQSQSKVQEKLQKALQEDPSIFDYDEVLPDINSNRKRIQAAEKAKKTSQKSKYIGTLTQKAEQRKYEYERVRETQILKQIEAEKEIFGEKPQYTTAKYKEHLKERKKWEEEQDRLDAQDEDVTTKADMSGFIYSNYSRVLGNRLVDSDPLFEAEKEKEKESINAIAMAKKMLEEDQKKEQQEIQTNEPPKASEEKAEDKEGQKSEDMEPPKPILTREEKIEQARQRYFERAKKQIR